MIGCHLRINYFDDNSEFMSEVKVINRMIHLNEKLFQKNFKVINIENQEIK